jgi:hypothetical protein
MKAGMIRCNALALSLAARLALSGGVLAWAMAGPAWAQKTAPEVTWTQDTLPQSQIAQGQIAQAPVPPADITGPPSLPQRLAPPGAPVTGVPPTTFQPRTILPGAPAQPPGQSPTQATPVPPTVQLAPSPGAAAARNPLVLSARFGPNLPQIQSGLHWRIYSDRPDPAGAFPLVAESRDATAAFQVAPGGYVVHVSYGLAAVSKRVQVGLDGAREVLAIPAGGLRMRGVVGNSAIPAGQISFEVFRGSQFDPGDKRRVADGVAQGDVVLVPEGTYHIVSNYGESNAIVRSDVRVQAGKLSDATVHHRAAVITLKLVSNRGGDALANTAWSVLTPGGDIVKEAIGAFPTVILQEGEYTAIARNEGRLYNHEFRVEAGVDKEVSVLAQGGTTASGVPSATTPAARSPAN